MLLAYVKKEIVESGRVVGCTAYADGGGLLLVRFRKGVEGVSGDAVGQGGRQSLWDSGSETAVEDFESDGEWASSDSEKTVVGEVVDDDDDLGSGPEGRTEGVMGSRRWFSRR